MRLPFGFLLAVVALPALAGAAETAEERARLRARAGAWAGGGVVMGRLDLDAETAQVETALQALPAVVAGVEVWPEESLGLYLGGAFGTGAQLEALDGGELGYTAHQLEAGARYRWFLGEQLDATALFVGFGARAVRQDVDRQRTALLVSSIVAGPELAAGVELPLLAGELWLRVTARGQLPFFVRETPQDSGDPRAAYGFGARAEATLNLAAAWAAQLSADLTDYRVRYEGEGTRATGTDDARTHDQFTTFLLCVRRLL